MESSCKHSPSLSTLILYHVIERSGVNDCDCILLYNFPLYRNYKYALRGPTLRITLTASCYNAGDATTETFVIDDLVQVCLKVECVRHIDQHKFSMLAIKHELAKNEAISMNVTCDELKHSKKWTCCDSMNHWTDIGETLGLKITSSVYVTQMEIIITVYNTTKPAFPKLYEDCDLTDFTLSTADGKVAVHKACLAVHSPVFKAMFTGPWKETKENLVEIKDYTLQTIEHLKDFLYLGTLPDFGLRPLITLAALYSINDLTKECARKLAETVRPEDLYSLHELACANNIPELSCAISQVTLEEVVDQGYGYQIKKKNNENQIKLIDKKQTEGQ